MSPFMLGVKMKKNKILPELPLKESVDPDEMASFLRMADDWWDPEGPFKPLHVMNGARLELIIENLCEFFHRDPKNNLPLKGLQILDIGCGGGLLCEPLTQLGAIMTGVDALERNIKTAEIHSKKMGLNINYLHGTIEELVLSSNTKYDVVLNMEVIEHVKNQAEFIKNCGAMLSDGGILFCSTINRTFKAFTFAILGAEYILRWLPKGTHQYNKFVTPDEIQRWLKDAGLLPRPCIGMTLNPFKNMWSFSDDLRINYITIATK
jgi:2-polyprenyl-6-hydroxyphenyl methylase/3-demethylubiquinone-9 3-methyltransferase